MEELDLSILRNNGIPVEMVDESIKEKGELSNTITNIKGSLQLINDNVKRLNESQSDYYKRIQESIIDSTGVLISKFDSLSHDIQSLSLVVKKSYFNDPDIPVSFDNATIDDESSSYLDYHLNLLYDLLKRLEDTLVCYGGIDKYIQSKYEEKAHKKFDDSLYPDLTPLF